MNKRSDPMAGRRTTIRASTLALTMICVTFTLLGTYALTAAIWVLAQLAEPGAVSVPRFWVKSLIRYPLHRVGTPIHQ